MKKSISINFRVYELFAIAITFIVIKAVPEYFGDTFRTIWYLLTMPFFIFYSIPFLRKDFNTISFLYCVCILIGFFIHKIQGIREAGIFAEAITRIVPVLIIIHYKKGYFYQNNVIKGFALCFFILECIIAIFERLTTSHVLDYVSESQAMNVLIVEDEEFRSTSLFCHPLWNANVVSVFLAFIMCCDRLSSFFKILLIGLGLAAIWAFNSRACMMVWMLIIGYRLLFYGKNLKWIVCSLVILTIFLPSLFLYLQNTNSLGRLDFDFSDSSTLTRLAAFEIFLDYPWSLNDMIMGGTRLSYPATLIGIAEDPPLENGILMDLGYWGFVLGPVKILGEVIISFYALFQFKMRDKFIIMIALWGVAIMNNNSFGSFLMVCYMCALLAFGLNQNNDNKVVLKG